MIRSLIRHRWALASGFFLTVLISLIGCATMDTPQRGSAQLWGDNCARCHNMRPPGQYNDDQWVVVMHHMREMTSLTKEEYQRILDFLKEGN